MAKTVAISATSDGDNEIVAAVSGKRIYVLGYVLNVNAAGTVQWKSGASTALSGAMELVDGGGISAPMVAPQGGWWFRTAAGEALVLATAAGVDGLGHLAYEAR
jgi:hypothetical protein